MNNLIHMEQTRLSRLLLFLCIFCVYANVAIAERIDYHGIHYEKVDEYAVQVVSPGNYTERISLYSGDIFIPDTITIKNRNYYISDITDSFRGCKYLKRIHLPNALRYIISMAFAGCISLRHIELPDNIEIIYSHAFFGCKSLRVIKLPSQLRVIKDCAFEGCTKLKRLDIPYNVTYVGDFAFYNCKHLQEIYVYAPEPPIIPLNNQSQNYIKTSTFIGIKPFIPVHIPKGSKSLYQNANGWNGFTNYVDDL